MAQGEDVGVLLVNLGSPDGPDTASVRRYLREFLMDGRVIDMAPVPRWLLVNGIIAPFRAPKSAHAYATIWGKDGSPLLVHTRAVADGLRARTGKRVAVAMRYGNPSIAAGLAELGDVARIRVVPLYPQYASATTGSVMEEVYRVLSPRPWVPPVDVVGPFHADTGFLDAVARVATEAVQGADHVLFSYHGLPTRQVRAAAPSCQLGACCDAVPAWCYRAQCLATSRALAARLDLPADRWTTTFQSRLGRDEWLSPATDTVVEERARGGVKRLAVVCPAFVADNLETLEEIGVRARESFVAAGGESLAVAPCVNADPGWIDTLARMVAP